MKSARAPLTTHRVLDRAHLRFYAAAVEGVALHKAWLQYLPLEDDYSAAKADALIDWIRASVAAEALAVGQPSLIGLLRRDPRRLGDSHAPSLDDFAASLGQSGDFSEAELVALWQEQQGPDAPGARAGERRARLIRRLREALDRLAQAPRPQPQAQDSPGLWLSASLAARLQAAGLADLQAVANALAQRQGPRWPAVPGVGAVWADRLAHWLASLGITAAAPALQDSAAVQRAAGSPVRPGAWPAAGKVADPRGRPLRDQDGQAARPAAAGPATARPAGMATAAGPEMKAEALAAAGRATTPDQATTDDAAADQQAVAAWLSSRSGNPHTARAYGRSAERLLAWCRWERGRGLRQLDPPALSDYLRWLQQLGRLDERAWAAAGWRRPVADWLGRAAGVRRDDPRWRPFDHPLSDAAVAREWAVVRGLLRCLRDAGHLAHSPWVGVAAPRPSQAATPDRLAEPPGAATAAWAGGAPSPQTPLAGQPVPSRQIRAQAVASAAMDTSAAATASPWPAAVRALLLPTARLGAGDRPARLRALLWLVLGCGLRPAEVVGLSLASLRPGDSGWQLQVDTPARATARVLVLPVAAATALLDYLATVGIDRDALWREARPDAGRSLAAQPLLRAQRGRRSPGRAAPASGLSYSSLQRDLQHHLQTCSRSLAATEPLWSAQLAGASARWLRQLFACDAAASGEPLSGVQGALGQASLHSTARLVAGGAAGRAGAGAGAGTGAGVGGRVDGPSPALAPASAMPQRVDRRRQALGGRPAAGSRRAEAQGGLTASAPAAAPIAAGAAVATTAPATAASTQKKGG